MVAVLGSADYSGNIAKKGTSTDITLYNLKKGENIVTLIEPNRYPERLAPLFFAVSEANKAVVVVEELNSTLGENLVMLQCCGIGSGYFILRNYIPKEKIETIIRGTILEKFEFLPDDPNMLREKLLSDATQQGSTSSTTGIVSIDHSFNVKGVGIVALGVVMNGSIDKHSMLKVLPGAKTTQLRSIQKHDDEFDIAIENDRVGLAIKNVGLEDIGRGTILTNDPNVKTAKVLDAQISLVKYWQIPIKAGMVVHIGHWMQFLTAKVETVNNEGDSKNPILKLKMDKELVYRPGDTAVINYLEGGKLRVAGTISLQ